MRCATSTVEVEPPFIAVAERRRGHLSAFARAQHRRRGSTPAGVASLPNTSDHHCGGVSIQPVVGRLRSALRKWSLFRSSLTLSRPFNNGDIHPFLQKACGRRLLGLARYGGPAACEHALHFLKSDTGQCRHPERRRLPYRPLGRGNVSASRLHGACSHCVAREGSGEQGEPERATGVAWEPPRGWKTTSGWGLVGRWRPL